MILNESAISVSTVMIGILFAALIAGISFRVKFLTLSGSIATFILAGFIFGLGGIKWSIPILTFFILSSILSKLRKKKNESVEIYFEKSGVRDYLQVIANGGLGGVLVVINAVKPNEIYYMIYLATLSAVCADTWATEIGTWKKTATYNILNLQPVAQGVSGGISVHGTIGAVLGSITILFSGILWIDISYIHYTILIITTGVFGCMIDSILGATIQAQNKCSVCNKVTERNVHCGTEADHFSGYKWINNDVVNFFSGVAGALFLLFLKTAIKI
ncbi:MAG: DUF92 domain-containing protein [Melioribacteraceae bacterium]